MAETIQERLRRYVMLDWGMPLSKAERQAAHHIDALEAELTSLRSRAEAGAKCAEALAVVLESVQWSFMTRFGGPWLEACPVCEEPKSTGHSKDCGLIAALRAFHQAQPEQKDKKE
jgi:hypothetical protein